MSDREFEDAVPFVRKRVLERVGKRRQDAEDVVQEAFIRAYKKAVQIESEEQLFAYVWTDVEEKLRRNAARSSQRRRALLDVWKVERQGAHDGIEMEARLDLEAACQELEPELREAVLDVLVRGRSLRETGLDKDRVARAITRIRERIG